MNSESVRRKIAGLLALAGSDNEAESKAALLKAKELMVKHKLSEDDCVDVKSAKVIRMDTGLTGTTMTDPWLFDMAAVVAKNHCCISIREHSPRARINLIKIVGFEDDAQICTDILCYAYDCVGSYSRGFTGSKTERRMKRNAYGYGFVSGLDAAYEAQKADHQEWALVAVVPEAVEQNVAGLRRSQFGRDVTDYVTAVYKEKGYSDGLTFNPHHRIAAPAPALPCEN